MHIPRKNSIWKRRDTGEHVVVSFKREHVISYIYRDTPEIGGIAPEDEFYKTFEWVRGR